METGFVNHADHLSEKHKNFALALIHRGEPTEIFQDPENDGKSD